MSHKKINLNFKSFFQSFENGLNNSRSVSESSNQPTEEEENKNRKIISSKTETENEAESETPDSKVPDQQQLQQTSVQVSE